MENNSVFIVSCQHGEFDPTFWVYDDIDNAVNKQNELLEKHMHNSSAKIRLQHESVFLKKYYTVKTESISNQ